MKYSFVLPAYKAKYLRQAIDSILAQTYNDYELIIVNDASPEDLDSIVSQYDDNRIKYFRNVENIGGKDLVHQWNHSISYAVGQYIILASDDDVYEPKYLDELDILVNSYPSVAVFRTRVQKINEDGNIKSIESYMKEYSSALEYLYSRSSGYMFGGIPFYVFKKDALTELGGFINFPFAWYSDDATIAMMAKNGIVVSDKILFSFRMSGYNITTKPNDAAMLRGKLRATDMYYEWFNTYMSNIPITSNYDKFYKQDLLRNIQDKRRNDCYNWVKNSTILAILSNSITIVSNRVMPFRSLVRLLLHKLHL